MDFWHFQQNLPPPPPPPPQKKTLKAKGKVVSLLGFLHLLLRDYPLSFLGKHLVFHPVCSTLLLSQKFVYINHPTF